MNIFYLYRLDGTNIKLFLIIPTSLFIIYIFTLWQEMVNQREIKY